MCRSERGLNSGSARDWSVRRHRGWRRIWWTIFDEKRSAAAATVGPSILLLGYFAALSGGHRTSVWWLVAGLVLLPFGIRRTRRRLAEIRRWERGE